MFKKLNLPKFILILIIFLLSHGILYPYDALRVPINTKETIERKKAEKDYYFNECMKLNLELIKLCANRVHFTRQSETKFLQMVLDDIGKLKNEIIELRSKVNNPKKIDKVIRLIDRKNEPAASAVLYSVALSFVEKNVYSQRDDIERMGFDREKNEYWILRGHLKKYVIGKGKIAIGKGQIKEYYNSLNNLFRAIDHEIDSEITELIWLREAYKALRNYKDNYDDTRQYFNIKDRDIELHPNAVSRLKKNLNLITKEFSQSKLLVKDIIKYSNERIIELIELGEFGAAREILGVTIQFIEKRGKAVRNIIENIYKGRLKQSRVYVDKIHKETKARIIYNMGLLKIGSAEASVNNLRGFLRKKEFTKYLNEPEFSKVKQHIGYTIKLTREGKLSKAEEELKKALKIMNEAEILEDLMKEYRDLYVKSNLDDKTDSQSKKITKSEAFFVVYKQFLQQGKLKEDSLNESLLLLLGGEFVFDELDKVGKSSHGESL